MRALSRQNSRSRRWSLFSPHPLCHCLDSMTAADTGFTVVRYLGSDGWHHIASNSGPLQLSQRGGETGSSQVRADSTRSLWLHPLPPPEAGILSILAPDIGPQLTCPLDGRAITAAAEQAQPYWS